MANYLKHNYKLQITIKKNPCPFFAEKPEDEDFEN